MASIQIISGLNVGETYELNERETLLGRHPDCHVIFRDSTVSRRHARITQDADGFYVDDVGSQHGTRLNGELVRFPLKLKAHDEILLSQTRIVFIDSESVIEQTEDRPSTIVTSLDVLHDESTRDDSSSAPKWRALLDITRSLGVSLDLKTILPSVLDNIFRMLPEASRGCIILLNERSGLECFAAKGATDMRDGMPTMSHTITEQVLTAGKAILSTDVGLDERFRSSESVLELKLHSVISAPLVGAADQPFGLIHLDAQDPAKQFSSDDLDVLVNIANLVGQAVDHVRLHETQLEYDRRSRDLETAQQVQSHFLPQDRPTLPGYELFDYYRPAEEVGGDYFGYVPLPDGQMAIAVGDVAGHGIPAALLMARLCSEARFCLVTNIITSEAIQALNEELCKQSFSFFITFAICILDPVRHCVTVLNAGHMPPLLRRKRTGGVESLGKRIVSPPLGIDPAETYQEETIDLEPGDVVLMYTDGVSEMRAIDDDRFGIPSVEAAVAKATRAQEAVDSVMDAVRAFAEDEPQEDDICVVAFGRLSE
jgi:serine phosphatase RsbU (regulator of sigma subunit)